MAGAIAVASGVRSQDSGVAASAGASRALGDARAAHRPVVVFDSLDAQRQKGSGQMAVAGLADPGRRTVTSLGCYRVYFAGGRGLCVARGNGFASAYRARIFGPDLRVAHDIDLDGVPSRARISPDGRYGAVTMFVTGHSYADAGQFSTQTTLIDLAAGRKIAGLEQFTTTRDGRTVTAVDVNYWGVTFARDSDRFYATLATGGKTYLVQGSIRDRRMRVLHENVECPSLSPDGTRIAFKKRTGSASRPWRLTVLDLATMRETPLAEARSIDDQVEWLDGAHVLYGTGGAVWEARADGRGRPARFLDRADSPAVVRW